MNALVGKLKEINIARFGSFGEYLFKSVVEESTDLPVLPIHHGRIDFQVGGDLVDVKATLKYVSESNPPDSFPVRTVDGVTYAFVVFFQDGVKINYAPIGQRTLSWNKVSELFDQWSEERPGRSAVKHKKRDEKYLALKHEIVSFIRKKGYNPRVIYRTVQAGFGKESPDNLIPKNIIEGNLTVFLDFKDQRKRADNLNQVYIIPDAISQTLELIPNPVLHKPKVDLEKIPKQYKFESLAEVYQNFDKIFT